MAKQYQVRVSNEFRNITNAGRRVAGLVIPTDGDGYRGELTSEQLKELHEDRYVSVYDEKGKLLEPAPEQPSEPVATEQQTDPAKMNRDQLNAYAASQGVEKPESYGSKGEVLEAVQTASNAPTEPATAESTGDGTQSDATIDEPQASDTETRQPKDEV